MENRGTGPPLHDGEHEQGFQLGLKQKLKRHLLGNIKVPKY